MLQVVLLLSSISYAQEDGKCPEYETYKTEVLKLVDVYVDTNIDQFEKINSDTSQKTLDPNDTSENDLQGFVSYLKEIRSEKDEEKKISLIERSRFNGEFDKIKDKDTFKKPEKPISACGSLRLFKDKKGRAGENESSCSKMSNQFSGSVFSLKDNDCRTGSRESGEKPKNQSSPKKTLNPPSDKTETIKIDLPTEANEYTVGDLFGVVVSALSIIFLCILGLFGRKKMNELTEKFELATQKSEQLDRKIKDLHKKLKESEQNAQRVESAHKEMFENLKKMIHRVQHQSDRVSGSVEDVPLMSASLESVDTEEPTNVQSKPKKVGGVKLSAKKGRQVEKPPVSSMVNALNAFIKIWKDNVSICQKMPGYERFNKRLFQNVEQYRSQLNIETFTEEDAESFIFPLLDLMVRFESELMHLNLQLSGRLQAEVQMVHSIVYQKFGAELERNRVGRLQEVHPMVDDINTSFQSVIDSKNVAGPYKGKVVEIWKVALMNMSGMKLIRRAEVISGS